MAGVSLINRRPSFLISYLGAFSFISRGPFQSIQMLLSSFSLASVFFFGFCFSLHSVSYYSYGSESLKAPKTESVQLCRRNLVWELVLRILKIGSQSQSCFSRRTFANACSSFARSHQLPDSWVGSSWSAQPALSLGAFVTFCQRINFWQRLFLGEDIFGEERITFWEG